jgi:hypothetical protein
MSAFFGSLTWCLNMELHYFELLGPTPHVKPKMSLIEYVQEEIMIFIRANRQHASLPFPPNFYQIALHSGRTEQRAD